jgi:hemoglobin/transferrin/lactoferrin receptor protein
MLDWRINTGCAVTLTVLVSASPIQAADNENGAPTGAPDGDHLEPISVTATRNPIEPFDYAGMVSIVDQEEIRARQPSSLDDVLSDIPNVEFTGGPRRTGEVPSIRGFDGGDIVVTLDGARQSFLSGHDGRVFVDPSLLREAEVVRGPASALYGSGGTGGVIALRTIRARDLLGPGDTSGVRLNGGYQDVNDERHAGVTAYGKPGTDLGLLASVNTRESGDIELADGSELASRDDILSGLFKGNWQPSEHSEVELSYQRFGNDAREPNNGQGAGGDNSVDKEIKSDTTRMRYTLDNPSNPWVDLDALVYRSEHSVDERRLDDDGEGPRGELLERSLETTGLRLDNRSRIDDGVKLTYGVETYTDEQTGRAAGQPRGGVPDGEFDYHAAYIQAELGWTEPLGLPGELTFYPGVRFDAYEASSPRGGDLKDDETSPRLGVTWKPTPSTLLFAKRADAFRAPTINEVYPTGVHFTIPGFGVNSFVPNTDLAPQRTETVEVGGGFQLDGVFAAGDRFDFKLSHFETDGEDFIDTEVNQPGPPSCFPPNCNGTTRSVNVGEAELWGQEIEADYRVGHLEVNVGFSRVDGRDKRTGDKLGVLTPAQITLGVGYRLPGIDSRIGTRILAADEFDKVNDPANERDAYEVVDLYYNWQPRNAALRGLSVRAGIDNVLDEEYARVFTGATEPGRNFKLSVGYNASW